MPDGTDTQRRGIQSVEVGFRLLQALADSRGRLPLKDLAAAADMPPSKAHLYLASYMRLGLVRQDPVTARYALGPAAIRIGVAAINQTDVIDILRRHVDDTAAAAGTSISLSVWANKGPTIVYRHDGAQPVPISIRLGFVLPMLTTSTGRVFLAHLPEPAWADIVAAEEDITPGTLDRVRETLPGIREQGYAVTESRMHEGFFGVSAPVFDSGGALAAAVTALGLSARLDLSPDGPVVPAITALARQVSEELGGTRP